MLKQLFFLNYRVYFAREAHNACILTKNKVKEKYLKLRQGKNLDHSELRIQKTRSGIEKAYLELLHEKEFSKITVTMISSRAQINKSTFYRHYKDILDLHEVVMKRYIRDRLESFDYYSLIFSDCRTFLTRFTHDTELDPRFWAPFLEFNQNDRFLSFVGEVLFDVFKEKLFSVGNLERSTYNEQKIELFVTCLTASMRTYSGNLPESMLEILSTVSECLFTAI